MGMLHTENKTFQQEQHVIFVLPPSRAGPMAPQAASHNSEHMQCLGRGHDTFCGSSHKSLRQQQSQEQQQHRQQTK